MSIKHGRYRKNDVGMGNICIIQYNPFYNKEIFISKIPFSHVKSFSDLHRNWLLREQISPKSEAM